MESTCGTFWALKTFYTRSCKKYNTNFLKISFQEECIFHDERQKLGEGNLKEVAQGLLVMGLSALMLSKVK